jgi:hypothetical protein
MFRKIRLAIREVLHRKKKYFKIIEHKFQEEMFHIYCLANGEKKRRTKTFLLYKHMVYFFGI